MLVSECGDQNSSHVTSSSSSSDSASQASRSASQGSLKTSHGEKIYSNDSNVVGILKLAIEPEIIRISERCSKRTPSISLKESGKRKIRVMRNLHSVVRHHRLCWRLVLVACTLAGQELLHWLCLEQLAKVHSSWSLFSKLPLLPKISRGIFDYFNSYRQSHSQRPPLVLFFACPKHGKCVLDHELHRMLSGTS